MFGWLGAASGPLLQGRRVRLVRRLVDALNNRDFVGVRTLLKDDFVYRDVADHAIEGADGYVQAMKVLFEAAPDLQFDVPELSTAGGRVLAKGSLVSADPQFTTDSLWHISIEGGLIADMQSYRHENAVPVIALYDEKRRSAAAVNGSDAP